MTPLEKWINDQSEAGRSPAEIVRKSGLSLAFVAKALKRDLKDPTDYKLRAPNVEAVAAWAEANPGGTTRECSDATGVAIDRVKAINEREGLGLTHKGRERTYEAPEILAAVKANPDKSAAEIAKLIGVKVWQVGKAKAAWGSHAKTGRKTGSWARS